MTVTFSMPGLTTQDLERLHEFARTTNVSLDAIVQRTLRAWLSCMEQKFSDAGLCPSCSLRGIDMTLKGLPILQAEIDGLVVIGPNTNRSLLNNMLYVICPACLWCGFPDGPQ